MQEIKFSIEVLRRCWFLAGPTASGKSRVGVRLARRIGAEIVSMDSMSIYRGMDIGTAKPSIEEREDVPHHLIDVVDPCEEFSVAQYLATAERVSGEILRRGFIPLFVGGTGLYLRSVLRGVFEGPPADWQFRRHLEHEAARRPPGWLHQELQRVDPAAAEALHVNDSRRLIRALEVQHLAGRPISEQQQHGPLPAALRPRHVYWLAPPRDWLHERIDRRVTEMFDAGLVNEVKNLLESRNSLSRTARQGLGYREVIEHLHNQRTLEETIALVQKCTRQFAKRQHTWFRNLEECIPVPMTGDESPDELAERLARQGVPEQN